jgi:hypothetical protein
LIGHHDLFEEILGVRVTVSELHGLLFI